MCLSPVYIDNPNRHYTKNPFAKYHDTVSQKIAVPCGRCSVCIGLKQNYIVQRVQMESLDNFIFFGTLTYNNASLPSIDVNGYNIKYASVRDFQNLVYYVRKHENLLPFRYMAVSEFGGRRHRPHWHFLLFYPHEAIDKPLNQVTNSDLISLETKLHSFFLKHWHRNVGSRTKPIYVDNCDYIERNGRRTYDLHAIDTISENPDDVTFYVSKYVTKFSSYVDRLKSALYFNLDPSEFVDTWNLVKPRFLFSKGFGNPKSPKVINHIKNGIEQGLKFTDYPYPCYFNITTGQSFPLSPYYRKKFLDPSQELAIKERQLALSPTDIIGDLPEELWPDLRIRKAEKFEYTKHLIEVRDMDLGLLFDEVDYDLTDFLATDNSVGFKYVNINDFENDERLFNQTLFVD